MQIAEIGWLLCVTHVDTIQQNVRAGAAQGLALTYSLPARRAREQRLQINFVAKGRQHGRNMGYLLEDAPVHDKHHNARYPEANRAGDERIGLVNHKCALIWTQRDLTQMLGRCIPAQKDGRK